MVPLKQLIPRAEKQSCLTCFGKKFTGKKHVAREVKGLLSLLHIFNGLLYMQNLL